MSTVEEMAPGGRQSCWLPMDEIRPNARQPRKVFQDMALLELAASIRQHGLLQPITVRAVQGGYEIVMGERRYRACRMLGFTHIDAFVLPLSDADSELLALIENIQREDLHYFEEAEAYARLMRQGMTQETLARRLGKSASGIANKLRLLKLDEGLSERHARALLPLSDAQARMRVARQAAQQHLTVRETEALVARSQPRLPVPPPGRRIISVVRDYRLYLNAIRGVINQFRETGVDAQMETREEERMVEIRILLPKQGTRARPNALSGQ